MMIDLEERWIEARKEQERARELEQKITTAKIIAADSTLREIATEIKKLPTETPAEQKFKRNVVKIINNRLKNK